MKWIMFSLCILFASESLSQDIYYQQPFYAVPVFQYRPYYVPPAPPVFEYRPYYIPAPPFEYRPHYIYPPVPQPMPTYVYGPRVWVHPKVYVEGQPVRNFLRAITP